MCSITFFSLLFNYLAKRKTDSQRLFELNMFFLLVEYFVRKIRHMVEYLAVYTLHACRRACGSSCTVFLLFFFLLFLLLFLLLSLSDFNQT